METEQDTGQWFIDGEVRDGVYRDRVWREYRERWGAVYNKKCELEDKHRREMAGMEEEIQAVARTLPLTPWVGRADTGPVAKFVECAKKGRRSFAEAR